MRFVEGSPADALVLPLKFRDFGTSRRQLKAQPTPPYRVGERDGDGRILAFFQFLAAQLPPQHRCTWKPFGTPSRLQRCQGIGSSNSDAIAKRSCRETIEANSTVVTLSGMMDTTQKVEN
jgi:hypothetical protein